MSLLFFKKAQDKKIVLIFLSAVFFFCIRNGYILGPDSESYINHNIFRMGLYPLSISFFQFLFKDHAFQALAAFQLIFAIGISYYLATFLQEAFDLPPLLYWILIGVFLSPLITQRAANYILSEGLAYPLFLLASYFFLKGILYKNIKSLYTFSFVVLLLSFTRQQYIFLYGIAILAFLFFLFFEKNFRKKTQFLLSIFLSLSAFFISERTYHYIYHNSFSSTPFTGTQLLIRPLFLSEKDSYKIFDDPQQREFAKEAFQELHKENFIDSDASKRDLNSFELHYNAMYYKIFSPLWEKIWSKKNLDSETGNNYSPYEVCQIIDKQTIYMALKLIKSNFINYIKSYLKDVIRGYGGYAFFGFVFFVSLLYCWNIFWVRNMHAFYLSFVFSSLMHFADLLLICLVEPPLLRYTYSTSLLLFSMLLIMAYQFRNIFSPSQLSPHGPSLCAA